MIRPRLLARLLAHFRREWWGSCPICRENFAKSERSRRVLLHVSAGNSVFVCVQCEAFVIDSNRERGLSRTGPHLISLPDGGPSR